MGNGEKLQKYINQENKDDIKRLYNHAEVANREMASMNTDMEWVKKYLKKLDNRLWVVLTAIIIGILIQIGFNVL